MQSLNHDLNQRRLERYLTLAWQSRAIPVVLLTKADLVTNCSQQIEEVKKVATHCEVLAISAKTGYGLDALANYLEPSKTIVFLGSSGVGKSSLVNAIAHEEIMPVKEIREDDSRGRHTTEPGCAIQLAIQSGSLAKDRWESYQKIKSEVKFVNKRRINHESNR